MCSKITQLMKDILQLTKKIDEDKLLPKSKTKSLLSKKVDLDKKPIEFKTKIILIIF